MIKIKKLLKPHTAFILLGIAVTVIYFFYLTSVVVTYSNLSYESLSNTSKQYAKTFGSMLKSRLRMLESFAADDVLRDAEQDVCQKYETLQAITELENIISIEISDVLGNSISSTREERNIYNDKAFKDALLGIAGVSAPEFSGTLFTHVVTFTVPIYDSSGTVINVLNVGTDSGEMQDFIQGLFANEPEEAFIIDSTGSVIYEINNKNKIDAKLAAEAALTKYGSMRFKQNGVKMISFFEPIEYTDWINVIVIPESYLRVGMGDAIKTPIALGIIMFIIILVSLVYAGMLTKKLKLEKQRSDFAVSVSHLLIIRISQKGDIIDANDNLLNLTGYKIDDLITKNTEDVFDGISKLNIPQLLEMSFNSGVMSNIDLPLIKPTGEPIYVLWQAKLISDNNIELAGFDVSPLKESDKKLKHLAYFDTLTNLPNKISLNEYVNNLLYKEEEFAMYYLDLDNFKYINETYGHEIGDKFILSVCKNIQSLPIKNTVMFRQGGDEFAFVYNNSTDLGEYGDYANVLINIISCDYCIDNIKINTSGSIGISIYPNNGDSFGALYRASEIAMNKAKEMGKSRAIFFNERMKNELTEYFTLVEDFKDAIKNRDLVMYYQPQYDFLTGELVGFEALMRWMKNGEPHIPPEIFIRVAEKNGMISDLGLFTIKEALIFLNDVKNLEFQNISVAVNISDKQFTDENLVESMLHAIGDSKKYINSLHLELRESVLMDSGHLTLSKLSILKDYDISLTLDDFGTGYSSLTYLQKYPFDYLKIDKSFVDTILQNDDSKMIISSIIEMAHVLKLKVIAEGVEYREQFDWLAGKGCDICQGYYTGKPVSYSDAIKLLGKNIFTKKDNL